jgi:hypothetical protein
MRHFKEISFYMDGAVLKLKAVYSYKGNEVIVNIPAQNIECVTELADKIIDKAGIK